MLCRLYNVSEGERFYFQLSLLHKKGCTSYKSIPTVYGVLYNTYKEAAEARHLSSSDTVWEQTFSKAATHQMLYQMRHLMGVLEIVQFVLRRQSLYFNGLSKYKAFVLAIGKYLD